MVTGENYIIASGEFIECPYSGAVVPWMCQRLCDNCIQKAFPKKPAEKFFREFLTKFKKPV